MAKTQTLDISLLRDAKRKAQAKADEIYQQEVAGLLKPWHDRRAVLSKKRDEILEQLKVVETELIGVDETIAKATGIEPKAKVKAMATGTRIRRTPEELAEIAEAMLAKVKSVGKDGISGGDLQAFVQSKFGGKPVTQPKAFILQFAGTKIASNGKVGSHARYTM